MEGLHLFHADVVCRTGFKFVDGCGGGGEVDVISERSWFKGEGHTLQYHFFVEVGCVEGGFTEAIDEGSQRLVLFLSDAKEGKSGGLMWATTSEMGSEHVGEGVKTVYGV